MKRYYPRMGLQKLCRLFGKTRQAFYDHQWRDTDEKFQEALILDLVKRIRVILPRVGGLKLLFMLQDDFRAHGISIGRDSFFTLLRKHGLLIKPKRKYARTTWSSHHYHKWPDLIQGLEPQSAQQVWFSDITYLRTRHGFVYLSLITDGWSHKIVGYHLSQYLRAQGCLIALDKAIGSLQNKLGLSLIHHSDRGIQYCCDAYVSKLKQEGISISMTQSGSPYDNPVAERVNGILKHELELENTFKNYSQAVAATHSAIDRYNRIRPHFSCSKLTPEKAHLSKGPLQKNWKPRRKKQHQVHNHQKPL